LISSSEKAEWVPNFDDPTQFSLEGIAAPVYRQEWSFVGPPLSTDAMESLYHSVIEEPELLDTDTLIQ